ncbi:unnamed protein product [Peronospora belbahrii]|uniref:Uncharacterized protein n=1 Tax=Peronospora belbahrii TaxID=622444 RepID=A0AAU9LBA8_9STRA|nr:unnamed protein product [Peronospora belbahrii]CAH0521851.1 unnamed protein product [Peronospora belbahrii]
MTECAIIGWNIQQLLGSSVALELLFGLPRWFGYLLTGVNTFILLSFHGQGDSGRFLELVILLLLILMSMCFFVEFTMSEPHAIEIVNGSLMEIKMERQQVMQVLSMFGGSILPHSRFLHSALIQERRHTETRISVRDIKEANFYFGLETVMALCLTFLVHGAIVSAFASSFFSTQCYGLSNQPVSSLYGKDIQISCIIAKAALSWVVTMLLCSVHYTLAYDILRKHLPDHLSTNTSFGLFIIAGLYISLLLYLLLVYPSERVRSHNVVISSAFDAVVQSEKKSKRADSDEEPLLEPLEPNIIA